MNDSLNLISFKSNKNKTKNVFLARHYPTIASSLVLHLIHCTCLMFALLVCATKLNVLQIL